MLHGILNNLDLIILLGMSEIMGEKDMGLFTIYETECLVYCLVLPFAIFFYKAIPFKPWDTARKLIFYILSLVIVFVTVYVNPLAAISLPIMYIFYFVIDIGYDNLKQIWAKWLHIEIEPNALDDEHVEGQTPGLDSYEIYESARQLDDNFERNFQSERSQVINSRDHFRRLVEKVRTIIRHQRREKVKIRDQLAHRYINIVESFDDSDSDQVAEHRVKVH
jgi:hypothetical protein